MRTLGNIFFLQISNILEHTNANSFVSFMSEKKAYLVKFY